MGGRLSKANCCKGDGASERTTGQEDSGHVGLDHGHFFLADAHDGHDHSHGHAHKHGDHASEVFAMGTVTLGPSTYAIDREGQCETGRACTFGVELIGAPVGSRAAMAGGPADVWLESASVERLGAPVARACVGTSLPPHRTRGARSGTRREDAVVLLPRPPGFTLLASLGCSGDGGLGCLQVLRHVQGAERGGRHRLRDLQR